MKTSPLFTISCGLAACVASFLAGQSFPITNSSARLGSAPVGEVSQSARTLRDFDAGSSDRATASGRERNASLSPTSTSEVPTFASILTTTDSISRMEGLLAFTRSLTAEEFPEALAHYQKAGLLDKDSAEYDILLTAWAKVDPQGALAGIAELRGSKNAAQTVISTWAALHPQAAETWARENFDSAADPTKGNPHMVGVITGLLEQELGAATRLLQEMPGSGAQNDAIKSVLANLRARDPESAKEWALSLAPGDAQNKAVQELAQEIAAEDPAEAIKWAASSGKGILVAATDGILDSWVENDPEAARIWAESQPSEVLAAAGPHLVKEMAQRDDYLEASEWLASHDGKPEFDESIEKLVKQARKDAPELAADWAARITDTQTRDKVLTKLVEKWLRDDPERAQEYLEQDNVPASVRRQLESQVASENPGS